MDEVRREADADVGPDGIDRELGLGNTGQAGDAKVDRLPR